MEIDRAERLRSSVAPQTATIQPLPTPATPNSQPTIPSSGVVTAGATVPAVGTGNPLRIQLVPVFPIDNGYDSGSSSRAQEAPKVSESKQHWRNALPRWDGRIDQQ